MVDNLIQAYTCPFCQSTDISDQNLDIVGAAGNTVNIDMHCPACNKHFMAKTELINMELGSISPEILGKIHNSLQALKSKLGGEIEEIPQTPSKIQKENTSKIGDESIVHLKKGMSKKDFTVEDLFT